AGPIVPGVFGNVAVVARGGLFRMEFNSPVVVSNGTVQIALLYFGSAAVVVSVPDTDADKQHERDQNEDDKKPRSVRHRYSLSRSHRRRHAFQSSFSETSFLVAPNVGAVGAFFDAEEAHVRKNLPLRHEGDSDYGSNQDEIGKLQKPIAFLEEDVESVD